jgi:hypothetical protein
MQARMWCFTLHANEDLGEHLSWPLATVQDPILHWAGNKFFKYCKYQVERAPDTGKVHLQGYLCLTDKMRLAALKKEYSARAHWEKSRGSIDDNEAYCSKEESRICGPFELGTKPKGSSDIAAAAKNAKWEQVAQMIQAGGNQKTVLQTFPSLAPSVRGIAALIEAYKPDPPLERDIKVFYIWGPTDVGKTHHAIHRYPKAFIVNGKYMDGKSFDNYNSETELILDEWSPYQWELTLMNSLLHKWKCQLACRYQNKYAFWNVVVICSNCPPELCYTAAPGSARGSFLRRLTHTMELTGRVEALDWEGRPQSPDIVDTTDDIHPPTPSQFTQ